MAQLLSIPSEVARGAAPGEPEPGEARGRLHDSILILGDEERASRLWDLVRGNGHAAHPDNGHGAHPDNGHAARPDNGHAAALDDGEAVPLDARRLRAMIRSRRVSHIYVADPDIENRGDLATALLECKLQGVRVRDGAALYEEVLGKLPIAELRPDRLVYSSGFRSSRAFRACKRVLDVVLSALLLLLLAPPAALIAIAIVLESGGPVLFRQRRIGLGGEPFEILKFRSMRQDAESDGPVWARENDDRVTRVGEVLRRLHLDELPQLVNVLAGEMSLVGPRPERPCFVETLRRQIPYYDVRHCLKPGITGWAQVNYDYGDSVEDAYEKLQYDLYYAKHASLRLDLHALLKTARVVLMCNGR